MSVFIDTSAFLAIINAKDNQHQPAATIWKSLIENEKNLISSSYVLAETVALIQNRLGMEAVKQFQEHIVPLLQIIWISETEYQSGISTVLESGRRKLSLVDCTSFAIMRNHGIHHVFCFDLHFAERGFEVLK